MDSSSEPMWWFYAGRFSKKITEESLFTSAVFAKTIVVIDRSQEDYYKGMCFLYGAKPKEFHVIENGHAVRFDPGPDDRLRPFAYQYDPVSLQLEYTPYTPEQRVGSSVAADAKP